MNGNALVLNKGGTMRASESLNLHIEDIKKIMQKYPQFSNLRVFGSVARGEDTEKSDIDFIYNATKHTLFDMLKLKHELECILGTQVDLVEEKALYPFIRKRIKDTIAIT